MFSFAWPWILLAWPLPWLAARLLPYARDTALAALRLPYVGLELHQESAGTSVPTARQILALLAWTFLLIAAARPQWLGQIEDVPRSGRDLLLAVDTSGSMSTQDMELGGQALDRFNVIQAIGADFIDRRQGDRVGLILFGSQAYLLTPLTFDLKTVATQLKEAVIGLAGKETAIGDAIGLAVKRLRDRPKNERVLILLTDGVNTAGELDPYKALELAISNHVRIYTIGIGAEAMHVNGFFGNRVVNPSADLDVKLLTEIAEKTDGQFFRARNSDELAGIYRELDTLEPAADTKESLRAVDEWFFIPLAAAMLIGVLTIIVSLRLKQSRAELVS